MDGFAQDVKYALRSIRQNPGLALTVLLTLALGIGANTAIFSVIDAVILRPLPYPDGERLVTLWERRPDGQPNSMTPLNYLDYASQNTVFERIAATTNCCGTMTLTDASAPVRLGTQHVSADFFDVFGVKPALGRTFLPGEDTSGRDHVAVLSHKTWTQDFGADPALVGRAIHLNGEAYSVIGVMPANSPFDHIAAMWVPLSFTPENTSRSSHWLISYAGAAVAKLKPGITIEQARTNLSDIAAHIAAEHPDTNKDWGVVVNPYAAEIVGTDLRRSLSVLLAAVSAVLLIACVNLANLMLARGVAKQRESAVRLALGASPARLIRQSLVESLLVGAVGCGVGVWLGVEGAKRLLPTVASLPVSPDISSRPVPAEATIALDGRVLAFSIAAALICIALFALLPTFRTIWSAQTETLSGGSRTTAPATHASLRGGLVVAEIALAFWLLICTGLLLRSLSNMQRADFGFDGTNVATADLPYPSHRFAGADEFLAFVQGIRSRVGALPGVVSTAVTNALPTEGPGEGTFVQVVGRPLLPRSQRPVVGFEIVSPSYFDTMGIRVLQGRALSDLDERNGLRVALINETMAQMVFGGSDALGQRVLMDNSPFGDITTRADGMYEIVGIVADERISRFADVRPKPLVYVSLNQKPSDAAGVLLVRMANGQTATSETLQRAVSEVDPTQAVAHVEMVDALKADLTSTDRFRSTLLSVFASVALLLAAIGIYGLTSYSVGLRKRELGIRSALGATPANLMRLVVASGLRLTLAGLLIGSAAAIGAAHLLRAYLFGVSTTDPVTLLLGMLSLAVVAALASIIPARRAATADPLESLRIE